MGISNFSNRLLEVRQSRKLTQEELSKRLGVTPQAVSKWERGVGLPDIELLYEIGKVLETSIDSLLSNDDSKLSESGDDKDKAKVLKEILAEPVVLKAGAGFVDHLSQEYQQGFKCVHEIRYEMARELGYLLPVLRIIDSDQCDYNEYQIVIYDKIMLKRQIENMAEFDVSQMYADLKDICIENYSLIINRQIVKILVKNLENAYPVMVERIIPDKISYGTIQNVLTSIINHKKPIRNLVKILELLEDKYEAGIDVATIGMEIAAVI